MHDGPTPRTDRARSWADPALVVSAVVLAALVIVQAGRSSDAAVATSAAAAAHASDDDFTVIAARSGRGNDADPDELLFVLDDRSETIIVYEIEDARRDEIVYRGGVSLPALFARARN